VGEQEAVWNGQQSKKEMACGTAQKYVSATACFTAHFVIVFPFVQFQNFQHCLSKKQCLPPVA